MILRFVVPTAENDIFVVTTVGPECIVGSTHSDTTVALDTIITYNNTVSFINPFE